MSLKQINAAIQKVEPLVELVRGEGYHYYVFDNVENEGMCEGVKVFYYAEGDTCIYETESVMVRYLNQQKASVWIEDGIQFGKKVRSMRDLPERAGE